MRDMYSQLIAVTVPSVACEFTLEPRSTGPADTPTVTWRVAETPKHARLTLPEMRSLHGLRVDAEWAGECATGFFEHQPRVPEASRVRRGTARDADWAERSVARIQFTVREESRIFLARVTVTAQDAQVSQRHGAEQYARLSAVAKSQAAPLPVYSAAERQAAYEEKLSARRDARAEARLTELESREFWTLTEAARHLDVSYGAARKLMLSDQLGEYFRDPVRHPSGKKLPETLWDGVWWLSKTGVKACASRRVRAAMRRAERA